MKMMCLKITVFFIFDFDDPDRIRVLVDGVTEKILG